MGKRSRSTSGAKRRAVSRGAFVGFTAAAVAVVALLIIVGRVSYSRHTYFGPLPTPTFPGVTLSPSITPSVPPSPTPSPSAPATVLPGVKPSPSLPTSGNSKGAPNAPVTIVNYSDYQCGHCQQFALTTEKELERTYVATGKVRMVFKHFIVFGDESMLAAQASECAAEQGKFWPYHDLLMQIRASPNVEDLTLAKLQSVAQQVGLNMETFNKSLESGKFKAKVTEDDAEGKAAGVTGTPTFFVNGIKAVGAPPLEEFQRVIEALLGSSAR